MITIGITFCDRDYQYYDRLLQQIKERVHVDYELIIIDNTEGNKLGERATYAFGHNAYQFAARYKIIKMAKGNYLWFLDGDDEVLGLDEVPYDDDVMNFNVRSETVNDFHKDELLTEGFFDWSFIHQKARGALWNKLIKRELYDNIDEYVTDPLLKVVSLEDTFYVALAFKNAKTVHMCEQSIYRHYRGTSSALVITGEQFDMLTTGFEDIIELFIKLGFNRDVMMRTHFNYFHSYLGRCDSPAHVIRRLMQIYPDKAHWTHVYGSMLSFTGDDTGYQMVRQAFIDIFGEENLPQVKYTIGYANGRTEQRSREMRPPIFHKWNHSLSIVLLVYDGNIQYLKPFTEDIVKRVHVEYEVIIVDNRDDKSAELEYACGKVVTLDHNVGILDGRRAGFEACSNEYVWFVDIDDQPLHIYNRDYGTADIIAFPFYSDKETICCQYVTEQKDVPLLTRENISRTLIAPWNKWYSRELLKRVYEDIPSFFDIYFEDSMLYYTALKYAKTFRCNGHKPIYIHGKNNNSVTTRYLDKTEYIDKLFIGYDEATEYMKNNFQDYADITYDNPYNIVFYLGLFPSMTPDVKAYTLEKLKNLFGLDKIKKSIEVATYDDYATHSEWIKEVEL